MSYIDYEVAHLAPLIAKERRVVRRDVDEFIGLCRGFAADGVILDDELKLLDDWIRRRKRLGDAPLVDEICALAKSATRTPSDATARKRLHDAITQLTGEVRADGSLESTSLPLTTPPPLVVLQNRNFCFSGTFECGERKDCESVTTLLGGRACKTMSQKVNYLVIGGTATSAWLHSSYGRKIQDAVYWNKHSASSLIAIISEKHWVTAVTATWPEAFD